MKKRDLQHEVRAIPIRSLVAVDWLIFVLHVRKWISRSDVIPFLSRGCVGRSHGRKWNKMSKQVYLTVIFKFVKLFDIIVSENMLRREDIHIPCCKDYLSWAISEKILFFVRLTFERLLYPLFVVAVAMRLWPNSPFSQAFISHGIRIQLNFLTKLYFIYFFMWNCHVLQ